MRQSGAAKGWLDNRALAEMVWEAVRQVGEMEFYPPAPGPGGPVERGSATRSRFALWEAQSLSRAI